MIKENKVFFKIAGLVCCSLFGITNLISLLIIAKKIKSKALKVAGWAMAAGWIFWFVTCGTVDYMSALFSIGMYICIVSALAPSILTLCYLRSYKVAHDLVETVKIRKIVPASLEAADYDCLQVEEIAWVSRIQIKIANKLFENKGNLVLLEIDKQAKKEKMLEEKRIAEMAEAAAKTEAEKKRRLEEERKKQETEEKARQEREFELAKIKAEKEKAEAEARILQIEKEKAEAEAKILQMKSEGFSTNKNTCENTETPVESKPKKTDKYVFISYSTKDNDIAAKTKEILEYSGINCWIAPWSINAGSDYASEIPKALNGCSAMVLLLSKASQESKWVPKEIGLAIENNKIIIPFQIDNEIISDSFNFYLTNSQRIAAFNRMNEAYDELIQSLYRLLQIN